MSENCSHDLLDKFIIDYIGIANSGFNSRWSQIRPDIYERHIHEVIGCLLARQTTLSIEMAKCPQMWNGNMAPLVLRCMTDAFLTLAWILDDPPERSKKYVQYGLGQEKLLIEHFEEELKENPDGGDVSLLREMVEFKKAWLNSQQATWATEVNVGYWSGISTRDMAKETGRESMYKFAYTPFSGAAHNMWQHLGIYNVEYCVNPLHKNHLVPVVSEAPWHPDFMYRSAKYLTQTFELFDEKMQISSDVSLPIDFFLKHEFFFEQDHNTSPKPENGADPTI